MCTFHFALHARFSSSSTSGFRVSAAGPGPSGGTSGAPGGGGNRLGGPADSDPAADRPGSGAGGGQSRLRREGGSVTVGHGVPPSRECGMSMIDDDLRDSDAWDMVWVEGTLLGYPLPGKGTGGQSPGCLTVPVSAAGQRNCCDSEHAGSQSVHKWTFSTGTASLTFMPRRNLIRLVQLTRSWGTI
jgi:hypothetical protein